MHRLAIVLDFVVLRHHFQLCFIGKLLAAGFVDNFLSLLHPRRILRFFRIGKFALCICNSAFCFVDTFLDIGIPALQSHKLSANTFGLLIPRNIIESRTRNNQRCPRLVDQNRIDLIDNRILKRTLRHLLHRHLHIVAKIIESEFVIRTVSYITAVLALAIDPRCFHIRLNRTHSKSKRLKHRSHPIGVTFGKIIVNRYDMNLPARQINKIRSQCRYQRLTLTGRHLRDLTVIQNITADQLNIKMAHLHIASGSFANHRKCLDQDILRAGSAGDCRFEFGGLRLKRIVIQRLDLILVVGGFDCSRHVRLDQPLVSRTEYLN